jgi:hypothetical protein
MKTTFYLIIFLFLLIACKDKEVYPMNIDNLVGTYAKSLNTTYSCNGDTIKFNRNGTGNYLQCWDAAYQINIPFSYNLKDDKSLELIIDDTILKSKGYTGLKEIYNKEYQVQFTNEKTLIINNFGNVVIKTKDYKWNKIK